MSEYTPTDINMRESYVFAQLAARNLPTKLMGHPHGGEWDRWLADHDAHVKAEALREFANAHRFPSNWIMFRRNDGSDVTVGDLLREVADRIERGDSDD